MLHLLKVEWLKVKNYKAFWIFTILYAFAIIGINYTALYLNELTIQNVPMSGALMGSPYGFPKVWESVGYISSWLLYFPGILFIMLFTNEFNFKTHRQNIIDGWTRTQFISVKFVFAALFSVVATLFIALVALGVGFSATGSRFSMEGMENLVLIFIQTFSYISFAMLLAVLFRRSGAAIAVFFLYGLIFEYILSSLINLKFNLAPLGYFLPLQITDVMLPIPFGKDFIYKGAPAMWVMVVTSIVFLGVYYTITLRKFTKDDL